MDGSGKTYLKKRVRATDYLVVAQLFLQDNFLLERELSFDDIKPRLLGHWGTCHGIDIAYSNLKYYFDTKKKDWTFVLGPGHGFPALQANLFIDGKLSEVDQNLQGTPYENLIYLCKNFSWPGGYPSHASPLTPGVICEGGELGYALGAAFGASLGHPEKTIAVLLGDGEFETATCLSSLNLIKLMNSKRHGSVLPILHLNGYKISGPTISGRKSRRELFEQIRGFGFEPLFTDGTPSSFEQTLQVAEAFYAKIYNPHANPELTYGLNQSAYAKNPPFIVMETEKGAGGPDYVKGQKVAGNYLSHQIPLKDAKTDEEELRQLEEWLKSYRFRELFDPEKGFML